MDEEPTSKPTQFALKGRSRVVIVGLSVFGGGIALCLISVVLWLWVTARPVVVPDSSMAPAIFAAGEVHVDTSAFGHRALWFGGVRQPSEPQRGDVVALDTPPYWSRVSVLRVLAVAGDTVQVYPDGSVDFAGKALRRCSLGSWPSGRDPNGLADGRKAYVEWNGARAYAVFEGNERPTGTVCVQEPCEVPPGHVFVLGDNRSASKDSRHFGFVPLDHVVGKVVDVQVPTDLASWQACVTGEEF